MVPEYERKKPGWTDGYRHCCYPDCDQKARVRITFPPYLFDDYIDSCGDHAKDLATSQEDRIAKL